MSQNKTLMITCSCEKQNKFPYVLRVADGNTSESVSSMQLECPFSHEEYCDKHLAITLPPGIKPAKDGEILRE